MNEEFFTIKLTRDELYNLILSIQFTQNECGKDRFDNKLVEKLREILDGKRNMNNRELVEEIKNTYSEWFEISSDPKDLLICILASKLIALREHTEYLEKRINHVEKIHIKS